MSKMSHPNLKVKVLKGFVPWLKHLFISNQHKWQNESNITSRASNLTVLVNTKNIQLKIIQCIASK